MITKLPAVLTAAALLFTATPVLAQSVNGNATTSVKVTGNATSSDAKSKNDTSTSTAATTTQPGVDRGNATSTAKVNGQVNAEAHRSAVANFVQGLLSVADRDGGIGAEVRVIAQAQNDAASTTAAAMAKVEKRSKFKTFLIGTDYKSLGGIRSSIATTANHLEQLKRLRDAETDASIRADLSAQITALEETQAELDAFVEAHDTFSLLGWFVKLFVR